MSWGGSKGSSWGGAGGGSSWGGGGGKGSWDSGKSAAQSSWGSSSGGGSSGYGAAAKGGSSWGAAAAEPSWGAAETEPSWGDSTPSWGSSSTDSKATGKAAATITPVTAAAGWAKPAVVAPAKGGAAAAVAKGGAAAAAKGGAAAASKWDQASSWGAPASGKGGAAVAAKASPKDTFEPIITKATADIAAFEKALTTIQENATKVLADKEAKLPQLKVAHDSLEKQDVKMKELTSTIEGHVKATTAAGMGANTYKMELIKLQMKLKGFVGPINKNKMQLKPRMDKFQKEADMKAQEAKDQVAFKAIMVKITKDVSMGEASATAVMRSANPVIANPPEGEALDAKVASVEASAKVAEEKLVAIRKDILEKIGGIKAYAPATKADAAKQLSGEQKKIQDLIQSLSVYKQFKAQLPKLQASKKTVSEVTAKLNGVAPDVTKMEKLMAAAEKTGMTPAKITQIDELVEPARKEIQPIISMIGQKIKTVDAHSAKSLEDLKTKANDLLKKITEVKAKVKPALDKQIAAEAATKAKELLAAAEEGLKSCQDAEMPFLTGVEVLDTETSGETLKECAEAATVATKAASEAKQYMIKSMASARTMEKELQTSTLAELTPLMKRADELSAKVASFRKETEERKTAAVLAEAYSAVVKTEKKCKELDNSGKVLTSGDMEDESPDDIKAAIEAVKKTLSETQAAIGECRNITTSKQKEAKAGQNDPSITKIFARIKAMGDRTGQIKTALVSAENVIKGKQVLDAQKENIGKAEKAANTLEEVDVDDDESLKTFTEASAEAKSRASLVDQATKPLLHSVPAKTKELLKKFADRSADVMKRVTKATVDSKPKREEVITNSALKAAGELASSAEKAIDATEQSEGPFIMGGALKLKAMKEGLATCDAASVEASKTVSALRSFIAKKTQECKSFSIDNQKALKEGMGTQTTLLEELSKKLRAFTESTKERNTTANVMEAEDDGEKLVVEAASVTTAAEVFTKEGGDKLSEKAAAKPLKNLEEMLKEIDARAKKIKANLNKLRGVCSKNEESMKTIKKCDEQVKEVSVEIANAQEAAKPHQQRAMATRYIAESKEAVATLDGLVKKGTDACAPLVEEAGKTFLVDTSISTLATVFSKIMKSKEYDAKAMFKEMGKGKAIKSSEFVKYITTLADEHDQLSAFTEERKKDIFAKVASDGKGLKSDDFAKMLNRKYTPVKNLTITNQFELKDAETVCTVTTASVIEVTSPEKEDDNGMVRAECTMDDQFGWITIRQAKQTLLKPVSSFQVFTDSSNKTLAEVDTAIRKVKDGIASKIKTCISSKEDNLKDAKESLDPFSAEAAKAVESFQDLKKKLAAGKVKYAETEKAEIVAHITAKNRKEALPFVEPAEGSVAELEGIAKAAKEAVAEFIALSGDELKAFKTPCKVLEVAAKGVADGTKSVTEAREKITEQMKQVAEVKPITDGTKEASKQLQELKKRAEVAINLTKGGLKTVESKCKELGLSQATEVSDAIRKSAQKQSVSCDDMFTKLAGGKTGIDEAAFIKLVKSLKEVTILPDHAKLMHKQMSTNADGILKSTFMKSVSIYYKVAKDIAFTTEKDPKAGKAAYKAETGEIVELIEGPVEVKDPDMVRIKGKSLSAGFTGWVSVSGNQGTNFLTQIKKPYYKCTKEVSLQEDGKLVRKLESGEILELISGPEEKEMPEVQRAKVKTGKDGKVGWISMTDETGKVNAKVCNILVIKKDTVMTDSEQVSSKDAKVIRRLNEDEEFLQMSEAKVDEKTNVTRVFGKALKDDKEGWVTTAGNQGTVFAEVKSKQVTVVEPTDLQKAIAVGGAALRKLEAGETLEVQDGPKGLKSPAAQAVRIKAEKDSAIGWAAVKGFLVSH